MSSTQSLSRTLLQPLLQPLVTPGQFDFWARQLGSTRAWERCFARVCAVRNEAKNTATLVLRANSHWAGFAAGQHCNVTARIAGRNHTRSYSISSAPQNNRHLEITVRRDPHGLMSNWLCRHCKPGDVLELGSVFGEMVLPQVLPTKLLLLAAGSGITPLMSILRELAARGMPIDATLLYWEKTANDFAFFNELSQMAKQHAGFTLQTLATRQDLAIRQGSDASETQGRINAGQLKTALAQAPARIYACGASGFVAEAKRLCIDTCADGASLFIAEAFTPATRLVNDDAQASYPVKLRKQGITLRVSANESLLEALEREGIAPNAGCRQGICNTCSCVKRSGSTRNMHSGAAENEAMQNIRICTSRAAGALELDL